MVGDGDEQDLPVIAGRSSEELSFRRGAVEVQQPSHTRLDVSDGLAQNWVEPILPDLYACCLLPIAGAS